MKINDGEMMPLFYGHAWDLWDERRRIVYPVPLNWIARWLREVWFVLSSRRSKETRLEKIERKAWEYGKKRGYEDGYHEGLSNGARDWWAAMEGAVKGTKGNVL